MMIAILLACDVMAKKVVAIHPKASLDHAIDLMADFELTTLPVLDISGTLVGMLASDDLSLSVRSAPGHDRRNSVHRQTVEEAMTATEYSVQAHAPLAEVLRLFKDCKVARVPVLRGDKLVGLIGHYELVQALGEDFEVTAGAPISRDATTKDASLPRFIAGHDRPLP